MASEISSKKKRQRRITRICLLCALALHAGLAYLFWGRIKTVVTTIAPSKGYVWSHTAPKNPTEPPKDGPEIDLPPVDFPGGFNPGDPTLPPDDFPTFPTRPGNGGDDIWTQDDSSAPLPQTADSRISSPVSIVNMLTASLTGFGDLVKSPDGSDNVLCGQKKRAAGRVTLGILDLPGAESQEDQGGKLWSNGELENISDFISRNTNVRISLGSRAISFCGPYASFDAWIRKAQQRALSEPRPLAAKDPEISALDQLANACPYVQDNQYEIFRSRIRKVTSDYLRIRFGINFDPEDPDWVGFMADRGILEPWQKEYLPEAQASIQSILTKKTPSADDLHGIYLYLRMEEMQKLWVLLCETPGVPSTLHPDNLRMLRTYLNSRGFIYFTNSTGLQTCMGVRSLITELMQERVADSIGEATLAKLSGLDRAVSGYEFRAPEPQIFHPHTFFPMILPKHTRVRIAIYNRHGDTIFADTLERYPGAYVQRNKHYRWFTQDNQDNPVGPGYYIYQIEADLCRKTGPMMVSHLTRLPNRKHPIFTSYFNIDEVPTAVAPKPEDLPYGEAGVYGYSIKGRQAVCYTEGYREKEWLKNRGTRDPRQEASLRWVTNVLFHALSERSLAL